MKTNTKKTRPKDNGVLLGREELLAAHERALKHVRSMTPKEGFETLVRAGIYTREGKLTPPYGG